MIITIEDDFDLSKIAYSGQCFRVANVSDNMFRFIKGDNVLYIKPAGYGVRICPSTGNVLIKNFDISCSIDEWDDVWFNYFDFFTNYSEIRKSIPESDAYLTNAAELGKGIRILKQDKFETLISFIISQRKSIPAIKKSVEMLSQKYGKKSSDDSSLYLFPTAEQLLAATDEELKECGLGYRIPYIKRASEMVAHKEINLDELNILSDEELVETLKSFHGVGDKVANCVALFSYHRIGLAPVDTWIKKIIENEYHGISPFGNYGANAGIMQQYMFYAAQHLKV